MNAINNEAACARIAPYKAKSTQILYTGAMVRALLDGSKTMTRRVVKPQPTHFNPAGVPRRANGLGPSAYIRCPYGQPGDKLRVKETFFAWGRWETRFSAKKGRDEWHFIDLTRECGKEYQYAADSPDVQPLSGKRNGGVAPKWWKRPAIFMPLDASRITLEITGVRVERLQDISEADALAEGVYTDPACPAYDAYQTLWESINGPSSWDANPWVWVVEFKRVEGGTQ